MIRLGPLILLVISHLTGFAQSNSFPNHSYPTSTQDSILNKFERLTTKDGLSDNSVNCILQDREGFLWFGTDNGLNKYDGYSFTVLQQDPTNPDSSLRSNILSTLYEDHAGKLWATTTSGPNTEGGGLHQIDKRTGKAIPIPIKVPSVYWKRTMGIYEDRQGILWIGSWGGLIRYAPGSGRYTLYPSPQANTSVICALEDKRHRFWVGTLRGLYRFEPQTGRFTLIRFRAGEQPWVSTLFEDKEGNLWAGTNSYGLMQIKVKGKNANLVRYITKIPIHSRIFMNAIYQRQPGQLWLGTTEGLQLLDTRTKQVITYKTNSARPSSLSDNQVRAVYQDWAGTLWLGTYQGINKQVPPSAKFTTIQLVPATAEFPSPVNHISALLEDHAGVIWFGSQNTTLHRYNPQTGEMRFIPIDPVNPMKPTHPYRVQGIFEDHAGQLWVSTEYYLFKMDRRTFQFVQYTPRIRRILSFAEDRSGCIWLGGEGGLARFNPKNGQFAYYLDNPKDPTTVPWVIVSRKGDVWMSVNGKGLSRLTPKTGQITSYYPVLPALKDQLNDQQITSLFEDATGLIWIGTNEGGLNWLNPATGQFRALTTQQGLPANHISAIINDRHGSLWISTSRGLCRLNKNTKTIHSYTTEDGLPHDVFFSKVSFGRNNDLLFGTLNGIVRVHTDQIYRQVNFPIYISHFSVFAHKRPLLNDRIQLSHDENFLSFEFTALNYVSSTKNQYAYQLVGIDKDWVENGAVHSANYTNLPPGNYTFQVRAANSDGIWSRKKAVIQLIILPPWWQTLWFRSLLVTSLLLMAYTAIRLYTQNRLRRQRQQLQNVLQAQEEERHRLASDLHDDLGATLAAIKGQLESLQQTADPLATPIRLMDKAIRDLRSISHNLMPPEFVQLGLSEAIQETVRRVQIGSSLHFQFITHGKERRFDNQTELTIYRIATELLNNAIKHAKAQHITIQLIFYPTYVSLLIEDDGKGYRAMEESNQEGIGLRNIRSRVNYLDSRLLVDSGEGGTTITLEVPL